MKGNVEKGCIELSIFYITAMDGITIKKVMMGFLLLPVFVFAAFYGNQSGVKWKSAETGRFLVHYPVEHRERAAWATEIAEDVYDTITNRYKIKLPSKINLVFDNVLYTSGEANPVYNMMRIGLTSWDFKLRGTHSWTRDVILHEFGHLVSMQSGSKTPFPWINGLQISKIDFYNKQRQINFATYIPFMIQPFWFAEGTAQYESSRMGFDSWDTHRDMLLRTAFLENKVLPLEFMEDFSGQSLEAELGPYTQGFDMLRYIAETYGDNAIPELWQKMGKVSNVTLSGALKNSLNITEKELYKNWKENRKKHYEEVRASTGKINEGKKITKDILYNDFISPINGNLYGLSNFGGDFFEGGVFEFKDSVPVVFKKFKLKKPYLSQGMNVKQTPELLLAYVTYQNRDKTGRPYFDIAIADTLGNNRIITKFADAVYPDISPDGKKIAFARREANGMRFYLSVVDIETSTIEDIIAPTGIEFNIYNPKFSPDGKKIAYSYFDGTKRKIGIASYTTNPTPPLAPLLGGEWNTDNRDPNWSSDGNSIYFSSDQTGIFNIYKMDLQTLKTERITNVLGGAFSPVADTSGLYYIGYDRDGFSIYRIENGEWRMENYYQPTAVHQRNAKREGSSQFSILNSQLNNEVSNEPALSFSNSERGYIPIPRMPILVPLFSFDDRAPDFGAVNTGEMVPKIGLAFALNDPLNKNFFQIAALQEVGKFGENSQSDLFAGLENRSFPITLNLEAMRMNTVSKDTVYQDDPGLKNEVSENASELYKVLFSASYSVFKKGDSLTAFASHDWAAFNLYQIPFRWEYHKRWQTGLLASFITRDSLLALQGLYSFSNSDLSRQGTFKESFRMTDFGIPKPRYRNFNLHEWAGMAKISISKLSFSLLGSGILHWQSFDSDTLDNFYLHPLVIEGYPILKDSENYFSYGTGTILAEARYKFSIYSDFRRRLGIFTTRDFNVSPFVQMGSAWEIHPLPALKHRENWLRSFGIDWRLENRIFYSIPFNFSFGIARGLDEPKDTRVRIGIGLL
ncbi:MAG: hypothetical protein LBU89_14220 [Fibromonadaceae bacterium]|nr:hypothetical protein [Fibromonadaceae bacterium]